MEVRFYDSAADELFKFAVIIAKYGGKYIFCKHKARDTYEIPGGHREAGENINDTARCLTVRVIHARHSSTNINLNLKMCILIFTLQKVLILQKKEKRLPLIFTTVC